MHGHHDIMLVSAPRAGVQVAECLVLDELVDYSAHVFCFSFFAVCGSYFFKIGFSHLS